MATDRDSNRFLTDEGGSGAELRANLTLAHTRSVDAMHAIAQTRLWKKKPTKSNRSPAKIAFHTGPRGCAKRGPPGQSQRPPSRAAQRRGPVRQRAWAHEAALTSALTARVAFAHDRAEAAFAGKCRSLEPWALGVPIDFRRASAFRTLCLHAFRVRRACSMRLRLVSSQKGEIRCPHPSQNCIRFRRSRIIRARGSARGQCSLV